MFLSSLHSRRGRHKDGFSVPYKNIVPLSNAE
jgi:hypothetical protein